MKTIKQFIIHNSQFIIRDLTAIFCVALLLTSCYQPKVVMKTTVTEDSWYPFMREVTYSNVMSEKERDSLWNIEPRRSNI